MKTKILALSLLCCTLTTLSFAQSRADQQHLDDPKSFSMILMGDPQTYNKYDLNQPIFELTTAWVADNIENLRIKAVLITGDLVETNENLVPIRSMENQTSKQMWEAASRSLSRMDNKIPYIISAGNHDYGYLHSENGNTHFPDYIPLERNNKWDDCLISVCPNRNGEQSLENAAFEFNDSAWGKILVITTEFAPRDEVLNWAKKLCESERYKTAKIIFMTHSFIMQGPKSTRITTESYTISPRNWAQAVWDKLIFTTPNIRMVICGHTGEPGDFQKSVGYREDENCAGIKVPQMMFNVQILGGGWEGNGGGWEGNGGDGWLRILEFKPDGKTIGVKTYSPLFGISPTTKKFAHRTAKYDQFNIVLK